MGTVYENGRKEFTTVTVVPLICGAVAIVTLAVAIATDHWLYTWDREEDISKDNVWTPTRMSKLGLWKLCTTFHQNDFQMCFWINFSLEPEKLDPSWTTEAIFYSLKLSLVAFVVGLGLMAGGLVSSTIETYCKGTAVIGALLYGFAVVAMGFGTISFISTINDEYSLRKNRDHMESRYFGFNYEYGWSSLVFLPSGFVFATSALISNVVIHGKRYKTLIKRSKVQNKDLTLVSQL